jgi:hypothetical protein
MLIFDKSFTTTTAIVGHIDELRYIRMAKYTAAFAPPSSALPNS